MNAIIFLLAAAMCCGMVHAQVPYTIDSQGYLTGAASPEVRAPALKPNALLTIDQHRTTVVAGVVAMWGDALERADSGLSKEQLRAALTGLRSDHLLAASLSGSLAGLRAVLAAGSAGDAPVNAALSHAKALGNPGADLDYTPVTPCRVVDTRIAGGPFIAAGQTRSYLVHNPAGNFTAQGGNATNCNIPAGIGGAALNVTVVSPQQVGYLTLWPFNAGQPTASALNFAPPTFALANGALAVVCQGGGCSNDISVYGSAGPFDLILDIVGYFAAPQGGYVTGVTASAPLSSSGGGAPNISLTGTVGTAQIADNAVTQGKLSPTTGAAAGKVLGTDGSALQWQTASAGTVTSVGTGSGLSGGPITSSGTINLAATQLLPAVACAPTQIPKWSGSAWACAADNDTNNAANDARYFKQSGNAFGAIGVLGTTDNFALDLRANGLRVMRYEPSTISPNVIGGSPANNVTAGVRGATIGGGGVPSGDTDPSFAGEAPNRVTDAYGTVGGGYANRAGNDAGSTFDAPFATVGGGSTNTASGLGATVSGGVLNAANSPNYPTVGGGAGNSAIGNAATVGGGSGNSASAVDSTVGGGTQNVAGGDYGTVGGGQSNTASGESATIGGGAGNTASGARSTIAGGDNNTAKGIYSTVGGGTFNIAGGSNSFAAGTRAMTQTAGGIPTVHNGAFVWADDSNFDFHSAADREFAARATGGVRFVTAIDGAGNPTRTVGINPNAELDFGAVTRQMLNLWGTTWGIGVQSGTMYYRTGNHFGWYLNGIHSDTSLDPGTGGGALMTLTNGTPGGLPAVTGVARAQTFTSTSDHAVKEAFAAVNGEQVLAALVQMPLHSWKYRNEDAAVRHIGPTAQDFRAAFGMGYDDKTIAMVDADGVALAAIQGLNAKLEEKEAQLARQQADLEALKQSVKELQHALRAMTISVAAR